MRIECHTFSRFLRIYSAYDVGKRVVPKHKYLSNMIARLALFIGMLLYFGGCSDGVVEEAAPPNILFIAVDDLRPELGAYGNQIVQTPHMDRLASQGYLFDRHYVTSPTCGASRFAMLRGLWPRTKAEIKNSACFEFMSTEPEKDRPESFFHHLRRNGYYTVGIGKIPHSAENRVYGYTEAVNDSLEMPHSWDEFHLDYEKWGTGWNAFFGYADGSNRQGMNRQVKPYENADVDDRAYPDGLMAETASEKLKELKQKGKPFVLAAGFFKPHLPWTAPKKYWDLYERSEIPISPTPDFPTGIDIKSLHDSGEFSNYELGEEKASLENKLSDDYQRKLVHAYYASISYVDAQIGKVLDELDRLGLSENTMVVLWGDHGWQLGDYRVWGKHTLFERSLRSALIIRLPGEEVRGKVINAIASTVDLYPTILEVAGLEFPYEGDGRSLLPLMDASSSGVDRLAYGYFRNGITVRNDQYRFTKYYRDEVPLELYDHEEDPLETVNIAESSPEIVEALMPLWQRGNTGIFE